MKRTISMKNRPGLTGLLLVLALILAACSGQLPAQAPTQAPAQPSAQAPAGTPSAVLPATGGATVQVADNPQLGKILVTAAGMTLYANTVDTPQDIKCTVGACTAEWPPYTVDAEPTAGEGITGTLGTTTRPDGSKQVTYNGKLLYTFDEDKQPGDTAGEGVSDLGGTWHAVTLSAAPAGGGGDNNNGSGGTQYARIIPNPRIR